VPEPDTPHFNFPFDFKGTRVDVVEQDTLDDIVNCVQVVLRVHTGWRPEAPFFGVPDFTFMSQPIGANRVDDILVTQEPRASTLVRENPDVFDELINHLNIEIGLQEGRA
jgi:hypothetical protein